VIVHGKVGVEYENATYTLFKKTPCDACNLASTSNKDMGKKAQNDNLYVFGWLQLK